MSKVKCRFESLVPYQTSCHVDSLEHVSNSVYFCGLCAPADVQK